MEKAAILKQFGVNLRACRLERGLTQEQLADRAALDRTYISGIERGERNPSLVNLARLAEALQIPLFELMKRLPPENG